MYDVLDELLAWWRAGAGVGVGTVVRTVGSAPRPAGTAMLVGPDGTAVGSLSGGCVEGDVYELAHRATRGEPPVLRHYGAGDTAGLAPALTCGAGIDVFVERIDRHTFPQLDLVAAELAAGRAVAVATLMTGGSAAPGGHLVLTGEAAHGTLGCRRLDDAVRRTAAPMLTEATAGPASVCGTLRCGPAGNRVFVSARSPKPRMIIFGAIDFSAALARVGALLGYRVTVCDARPVFATAARLPAADEVVVDWPHRYLRAEAAAGAVDRRTVVCVLTHDPKFDIPLLETALTLPVLGYVGAMGSRRTDAERRDRLRAAGIPAERLARLRSPIGLDLGARSPAEVAIAIGAEIIAAGSGASAQPLSSGSGPDQRRGPGGIARVASIRTCRGAPADFTDHICTSQTS